MRLPPDAPIKQEIDLPRKLASIVLGVRGATAGRLRRESGAKLHVVVTEKDNPLQILEIEGLFEQVARCVGLVRDLLSQEAGREGANVRPRPEVSSRFLVLSSVIGPCIIGKGGSHVKSIKDKTGAKVEVTRERLGARVSWAALR
ncbi:hypothetical protein MNEG_16237 [Monoraphidium neglectum]|uniref:K Homology domain-containing protein n=1 Tax=Monoraphidium neglectum TaxID=145388 RepID=A0A0D2IUW7_9CHLO|nr:hypothetical protein MNEG_16237 [Monoraphidium neglectum]KIY91727.1 hypothetical protein MNEG_16237 [Monoraphidium neglectum]|eukprot:XP_013890747.1 hypothetical protein MNEG_16237 [Monoraphidium neglectum]